MGTMLGKETQFKFGSYFSDNMVLQREPHRNLIWGYSPSLMVGQKVGVEVSNRLKEYVTVVQMGGRWEVLIDPHLSTGPHDISASLGSNVIWLRGVLFGDIWLCAGSSVLASPIHEAEYVANNWDMSDVRTLTIPDRTSQKFVDKGSSDHDSWHVPSKHSLSKFSAACWAFGLRLQQRLGRPVGLIQATSADSTIESWLPDGLSDNCNRNLSTRENSPKRSSLFNGMLQPYLKMSIGGILWYHGENDNTAPNLYTCYLRHLVSDFDKFWNNGVQQRTLSRPHQTPWAIVQLGATVDKPAFNAGDLRWAQTAGKGFLPNEYLPNTFMAVTVDISQVTNGSVIVDVGTLSKRLVSSALNFVNPVDGRLPGPSVQAEGPRPFDIKVMDDTIIVHYHLDREQHSLEIRTISGFEACCIRDEKTSCQRYPSNIVSNALTSVALSNPCITKNQTSALRYLWSPSPCKLMACPIYSRDSNLPASPWIWDFHSVANFR